MKQIIIATLSLILLAACNDECADRKAEHTELTRTLDAKRADAAQLLLQLESFDVENTETISELMMVEDELMMVALDIAVLQSNIESMDQTYRHCLGR